MKRNNIEIVRCRDLTLRDLLTLRPDGTNVLEYQDGKRYIFDIHERLIVIADRNGIATSLVYTAPTDPVQGTGGDLVIIVSPDGRTILFGYDANHHIVSATDRQKH